MLNMERKGSGRIYVCLLVLVVLFPGCRGDSDGVLLPADEPTLGEQRGSIVMISLAQDEIRKTNPDAIIIWAGGRTSDGSTMSSPEETDIWDFIALENQGAVPSWNMSYDGTQWTIEIRPGPPGGIEFLDLTAIWMDVDAAWELVQDAGLARPFTTWELFKDLNPSYPRPLFAYDISAAPDVFVDAISGEVFE